MTRPPARPVHIRPAEERDLDFLVAFAGLPRERLAALLPWRQIFIAEWSGTAVGQLRLEYLWGKIPYVSFLHVLPASRGQGVGRALLTAAEQRVRDDGGDVLYSSAPANEAPPQAWHRHLGFVECGFLAGANAGGVGEVFFRKVPGGGA